MAKILIIEDDSVFAAVLEDRMHVAGHSVEQTADSEQAIALAAAGGVDLIILKMELPDVPGLDVLQSLRSRFETRSIPIIVMSPQTDSRERVAALKAGADEFLSQPIDLEELSIRVGRLLGSRGALPAVMQGDLSNHPPWELMQFIQQSGKSGQLVVRSPMATGQMQVVDGRVTSARFKKLEGRDALLSILDLKSGHFRLTTEEAVSKGVGQPKKVAESRPGIPIPEVLMSAAWLEDELRKRGQSLPATGVPLAVQVDELPEVEKELSEIPIAAVFARLQEQSGRLFDLLAEVDSAPSKIRLAVAWLVEHGAVSQAKGAAEEFMTTTEISSSVVLDVAVGNLLLTAKKAGFETDDLPYLILVEASVWPHLRQLLERVPGYKRHRELPKLVEHVGLRQGGSASFETEVGSLSLHVQVLSPEAKAQIQAVLSVCAGVLLWLDEAKDQKLIEGLIQRLQTSPSSTMGVLVSHRPELQGLIADLAAGQGRWQSSGHAPQSLIGVLRMLHPRA